MLLDKQNQREELKWIVMAAEGENLKQPTYTGVALLMKREFQHSGAPSQGMDRTGADSVCSLIFLLLFCQPSFLRYFLSLEIWIYSVRLWSSFASLVSYLFSFFRSRFVLIHWFSFLIFKGISLQSSSSIQRSWRYTYIFFLAFLFTPAQSRFCSPHCHAPHHVSNYFLRNSFGATSMCSPIQECRQRAHSEALKPYQILIYTGNHINKHIKILLDSDSH